VCGEEIRGSGILFVVDTEGEDDIVGLRLGEMLTELGEMGVGIGGGDMLFIGDEEDTVEMGVGVGRKLERVGPMVETDTFEVDGNKSG
jgi:hypothetical protein